MNKTERELIIELKRSIYNLSASPFKEQRIIIFNIRVNKFHPT